MRMELSADIVAEVAEAFAIDPADMVHYNDAQLRLLAQGLANARRAPRHLHLITVDGERVD
jgi:hypothetical protein